jgi:hypothetical protein
MTVDAQTTATNTTPANATASNATTTTAVRTTTTLAATTTSVAVTSAAPGAAALGAGTLVGGLRNVTCPWSRWQGAPRYCYECRWCPFRKETCCEMEDEIQVLKSVNVSGSTDWDCFITIVHFQQCGRCDPNARSYIMNKTLNYVWDPRGVAIRPCKQSCRYIYKQCRDAKTLVGEDVIAAGTSEDEFCADYPEFSSAQTPCFDSAGALVFSVTVAAMLLVLSLL